MAIPSVRWSPKDRHSGSAAEIEHGRMATDGFSLAPSAAQSHGTGRHDFYRRIALIALSLATPAQGRGRRFFKTATILLRKSSHMRKPKGRSDVQNGCVDATFEQFLPHCV